MNLVTVKIEGMSCGMCEAHICDTIRNNFPDAKKVTASRKMGIATFLTENAVNEETVRNAINETGYTYISLTIEPYKKHSFFSR